MALRIGIYLLGGAISGFAYHRVIGCRTGQCMIGAHPYRSTIYGAFVGLMCFGAANY